MKVLNVSCNNCGAPLEVPRATRFVTCKFCESRLKIQNNDSAYFTSVIEAVHDMKDDVETIKMQNRLERVDREWSMEREGYVRACKQGHRSVPTAVGGIFIIVLASIGGLIMTPAVTGSPMIGIVFAGVGIMIGLSTLNRARQYGGRRERYEAKRRELTRGLRGR